MILPRWMPSWSVKALVYAINFSDYWLSQLIGFPYRFYMARMLGDRVIEAYEYNFHVEWTLLAWCYWLRPCESPDPNLPGQRWVWYFGTMVARCRQGHRHETPYLVFIAGMIWFLRRGRWPLKYGRQGVNMMYDYLMNEIKWCGIHRREVPKILQKREEVPAAWQGVEGDAR